MLWRNVRPDEVKSDELGTLVLSSNAFNDRSKRISVDRENIRVFKELALLHRDNGLVGIKAEEIRIIRDISTNSKPPIHHDVDAIPDPIEATDEKLANQAHSLIVSTPAISGDGPWMRLKERLARLAAARGWLRSPGNHGSQIPLIDLSRYHQE